MGQNDQKKKKMPLSFSGSYIQRENVCGCMYMCVFVDFEGRVLGEGRDKYTVWHNGKTWT